MAEHVVRRVKYSNAMSYIQSGSGIESFLPKEILCLFLCGFPRLRNFCNNWFYRRKAFAMSAFQAIDSFVPAVLVGIVALAIATCGWQPTAKVMGLVLLVVIVPLSCWIT